jgi:hypothetical protein
MNEALLHEARARHVAWDASRQARVLGRIHAVHDGDRRRARAASVVLSSLVACALVVLAVRALGAGPGLDTAASLAERGARTAGSTLAWDDAGLHEAASD